MIPATIKAGPGEHAVSGFLLKDGTPAHLAAAIRLVETGDAAEIAGMLTLREATVKTYVARIFAKLALRDRTQAVVLAYETGLVTPDTNAAS